MGKKYKTEKDLETGLLRIIALKDFYNVKKGDKGGLIEKETNLSQYGDCWVYEGARVYGEAWVYGDACVYGNAQVYGDVSISGYAEVEENARVCGNAVIAGRARVYGNARVCGNAVIAGRARVCGNADVSGNVKLWSTENSYVFTSIKNNKDYVMLVISDRNIVVVAKDMTTESRISLPSQTEDITAFTITALDYINNIQTIRQLYGKEV